VRTTFAVDFMPFNRRKLEDQRREAAEKEPANQRATNSQVLEDAERLITAWNERQAKHANAVLANDRRRHRGGLLVPMGSLPGVPDHQCDRSADARSSPRCSRDQPHSGAVVPAAPATPPRPSNPVTDISPPPSTSR
jgi:hypothetical protein